MFGSNLSLQKIKKKKLQIMLKQTKNFAFGQSGNLESLKSVGGNYKNLCREGAGNSRDIPLESVRILS